MSNQVEEQEPEVKGQKSGKAAVDPFMVELAASFNQAIEPDSAEVKLKPMAPVDLTEEKAVMVATQTVGEVAAELDRRAALENEQKSEVKGQKSENKVEPAAAAPEVPKEAPKEEPQVKVKPRRQEEDRGQRAEGRGQEPPPSPLPVKEAEVKAAPVVDEYEKGLSDGQREELEMARAAEKFLPEQYRGQADKLVGFFKKVDEFANSHPDLAPESEEFKEFVERQRPAYREGDRRRVDRMQIKAEVTEATRKEMAEALAKETGELRKRQHELEEKPLVAKTMDDFQGGLFAALPKGADESLAEVGKVLQEEGFAEAAAKFPVEAPIYESTVHAAREYLELVHGLKGFNEQDSTHRWLVSFIDRQVEVMKGDAERRVQNGKEFLAPHEFVALAQKDSQVGKKHWTFSEEQILDMLAYNAHLSATNRIKELESGGFKRNAERGTGKAEQKSEVKGQKPEGSGKAGNGEVDGNGKLEAEDGNGTVSPRAGTTGAPGLATGKPNLSENAKFLEALVPGGGKFGG